MKSNVRYFIAVIGLVLTIVACAPMLTWVTPKGQEFTSANCYDHHVSKDGGPEICRSRVIASNPKDKEACHSQGGVDRVRSLFGADEPLLCIYPSADEGKACSKESDCTIACDAPSRTCRGINSLGAVLDENGQEFFWIQ